ncbi:MAG TPA: hypothetical protein ENG96_01600, partial [Gammaproteobacteria bacterium]|nr:hypothetical protein [Gammaproteobacteria bacterium]
DTSKDIVLLNLRPLWKKYSNDNFELSKIEENFYRNLASSLTTVGANKRIIFIPMNSDQYGFSDLESAYRLQKYLEPELDFVVLEYEPDILDLIFMLRKSTLCIAMRFHACIFALSQSIPLVGIDYHVGGAGKVSELMDEYHKSDMCINICDFKSDSLGYLLKLTD